MKQNKHILILCSRIDLPGGIEKAVTVTANLLAQKGHPITLLILDKTSQSFFPLHPSIRCWRKDLNFGITEEGNTFSRKLQFFFHCWQLRQTIKKIDPAVILCSEYPFTVAAVLATTVMKIPVVAWEHHHFHHLVRSTFWQWAVKRVYPKVVKVICLNPEEASFFQAFNCTTYVIPNFIEQKTKSSLDAKAILTIGWLSKTKGMDTIPQIAEKVFLRHPDWSWKIIGNGDLQDELENEIKKRNLANHVLLFPPTSPNISQEYLNASIYVMPSRFECFPMVLLEAMSHGVPAVSFDCPTGPRHILQNSVDGILVPKDDIKTMEKAIFQLIEDAEKRNEMGRNAFQSADKFSVETVYPLWARLLDEVTSRYKEG